MSQQRVQALMLGICIIFIVLIAFQLGVYSYQRVDNNETRQLVAIHQQQLAQLQLELQQKEAELGQLRIENTDYAAQEAQLLKDINSLRTRVAGLSTNTTNNTARYPFAVPTTGIVGSQNGTFGGQMYTMKHLGIDIWTTQANGGRIASHRGNAVFAACDGKVVNIKADNAGLTIACDEIVGNFNVPARQVYTHYSHLGHAETKELYILVQRNQRVKKGQKLGYQGDLSSYFPQMRNVHLHFSVFTGRSEVDPNGGAINPCLYIGGDCTGKGELFFTPYN